MLYFDFVWCISQYFDVGDSMSMHLSLFYVIEPVLVHFDLFVLAFIDVMYFKACDAFRCMFV